jgi:hypothetical protein
MKKIIILCYTFGLLCLSIGVTNPTTGENLLVGFGIGILGWTLIIHKLNNRIES